MKSLKALRQQALTSTKTVEMSTFVFDSETLPNYTLFAFKNVDTGEYWRVRRHEDRAPERLMAFLHQPDATFAGFNNKSFDDVIASAFCVGRTEPEIKRIANDVIENRLQPWAARRKYSLPDIGFDSIDLIEVAPSFVGLKAYGARMHMPLLQDMPIAHDEEITPEQRPIVDSYCDNDLDTTEELLKRLDAQLLLRVQMSRQYGVDMRSKSDSQMAEHAYIKTLKLERRENKIPATITYTPPAFLVFKDPALQALLERTSAHVFEMNKSTGHVILPAFLGEEVIKFGSGSYQLGVGGIHSTHDKSVCHVAGDGALFDIDVTSYYPSIILNCGLVPAGLGQPFLDEYRRIYNTRVAAKRAGDKVTMDTLRIALNGTFGKLASRWSVLYAPDLMLAVTLTGQFTLLMLIEWLEHVGAQILSANTDGIAIGCKAELKPLVEEVVERFSKLSGYNFEYTGYRALAMKDVNNYFAVKYDRSLKAKGIYASLSLSKNVSAQVCADAVGQWLANGVSFLETIKSAHFTAFLSARNVTGGGEQCGLYLGKVVRWYQTTDRTLEPLKYVKNGNKVPKTDGARACMDISGIINHPADLDYDWYNREAISTAIAVGCSNYLTEEQRQLVAKPEKKAKNAK